MSRPDEGLIHQWLDGECTPDEAARLEHLVATDPEWAAAVAEARGLIAASSRIVQSLDAVPRAMPRGSVAAPQTAPLRALRSKAVKPWMRIAAAVVLVAGTAYVLRERATEPFVPTATVDAQDEATFETPAQTPPSAGSGDLSRIQAPTTVPPLGVATTADRAVGAEERGATENAPAPVLSPQVDARKAAPALPSAPVPAEPSLPPAAPPVSPTVASAGAGTRAEADQRSRAANLEVQRRSRAISDSPRGAIARPAIAPSAAQTLPTEPLFLDGCWRVTAPPQLVGVLDRPAVRRQSGDTLVLITLLGNLTVIRENDALRGDLQAVREACPSTP